MLISYCFLYILTILTGFNAFPCGFKSRILRPLLSMQQAQITAINRQDFPILQSKAHESKPLVYLDSAASSQRPIEVIEAMSDYSRTTHANVHRGAYELASKATDRFEWARNQVQSLINASRREEVVFTHGATEALNLVALSLGDKIIDVGDEIILTVSEHHSNLVPWQILAKRKGAVLKFVKLDSNMALDVDHFKSLLSPRTKLVSMAYVSNVLGTINPIKSLITITRSLYPSVLTVVDACQAIQHMPIEVQDLDVDFLVASGHKMCGPTGIGFLYGKYSHLSQMPPVYGGGEMIDRVELDHSTYALPPSRFEAGTPAIAEAYGLGVAIQYLTSKTGGMTRIFQHNQALGRYLYAQLRAIPKIKIYGPDVDDSRYERTGLVTFNVEGLHPTDIGLFLDQEGIAVRTGHHCAQPFHKYVGVPGSVRASLSFYNSQEDVDYFIEKLKETIRLLSRS